MNIDNLRKLRDKLNEAPKSEPDFIWFENEEHAKRSIKAFEIVESDRLAKIANKGIKW